MGEFQPLIDKLSDDVLNALDDGNAKGILALGDVVPLLRLVRQELEFGERLSPEEITSGVRQDILGADFTSQLDSLLEGISAYWGLADERPQARRNLEGAAQGLRDLVIERLRPIVRADEAIIRRTVAEAQQVLNGLLATQSEMEKQQLALARTAGDAAASDLSTFYETQARGHAVAASRYLWASGGAGVALVALTVAALFVAPPDYTSTGSTEQWIEVVRGTIARLAVLSIVAFALVFCVRNYRVNMHLEVLNKRRENALNTFGLVQGAVTSEDARNIVVGELVRAVFMSEETGYLGTDTERTVIESPGGVGMITALTRGAGPK